MSDLKEGDLVRVGSGKTTWRIVSFWHAGEPMAQLQNVDAAWVRMSSVLDRLVPVEATS